MFLFGGFLYGLQDRLKLAHEPKLRRSWQVESTAFHSLQLALIFWLVFFLGAPEVLPPLPLYFNVIGWQPVLLEGTHHFCMVISSFVDLVFWRGSVRIT